MVDVRLSIGACILMPPISLQGKAWDEEQEYTSAESMAWTATPRTPTIYEILRILKKTLSICGDNSWAVGLRVYGPRLLRRNTAS